MLGTLDWAIIAAYFLILLGIVYWTSRRNESTDDYFLAGRNVGWFAIGASLFASNIGSEHIVGLAGAEASTGMGKLTLETFYGGGQAEPSVLAFIGDINFTYMSGILFAISVALILAVSHATSPPNEEQIRGLTYASIDHAEIRRSWNTFDLIATLIVLGLVISVYTYFSFWI